MRRSNLQPGSLLTREERFALRLIAGDLTAQIHQAPRGELDRLQGQLGSVRREQAQDRATRPRGTKRKGGR